MCNSPLNVSNVFLNKPKAEHSHLETKRTDGLVFEDGHSMAAIGARLDELELSLMRARQIVPAPQGEKRSFNHRQYSSDTTHDQSTVSNGDLPSFGHTRPPAPAASHHTTPALASHSAASPVPLLQGLEQQQRRRGDSSLPVLEQDAESLRKESMCITDVPAQEYVRFSR